MFCLYFNETDFDHWEIKSDIKIFDCCDNMKTIEILDNNIDAIYISENSISKLPMSQERLKNWNKFSNLVCRINSNKKPYYVKDIIINEGLLHFHVRETNCVLPYVSRKVTSLEKKQGLSFLNQKMITINKHMLIEIPNYPLLETTEYFWFNLRFYNEKYSLYEVIIFYPQESYNKYSQAGQTIPVSKFKGYAVSICLANVLYIPITSSYSVSFCDTVDTSLFEFNYEIPFKSTCIRGRESGNDGKRQDNSMTYVGTISITPNDEKNSITKGTSFNDIYGAVYKFNHPNIMVMGKKRK